MKRGWVESKDIRKADSDEENMREAGWVEVVVVEEFAREEAKEFYIWTMNNKPPGVAPADWVEFGERLLKRLLGDPK